MIKMLDKTACSGCSACASVCPRNCIKMMTDAEGFEYPSVEQDKCIDCGACERVCPIKNPKAEVPHQQYAYVVQNRHEDILRESTAGGAFTAIAKYVIRRNGVVFGAALSDNLLAHHIWVDQERDLSKFRNSKYMQSYISEDVFKTVKGFLKQGRYVCFSGTPCQVEGLRHYLGKEYENLIIVDVVCRAVPSPMVFQKYMQLQEKRLGASITNVRFRDKHYGYKYSTMNVTTENNDGNYHQGVESDPWLRAFFSGMCLRPSCYKCQFKKRYRISDFTMWDCFNVGRFSKGLDNDRGATRLLIHTKKGKKVFDEISEDLKCVSIEPEKIIEGTGEMLHSVKYNDMRDKFMKDAQVMNPDELFAKYFPVTFKVRLEHGVRLISYRLGIYSIAKKAYVRLTHKY